jgi:ADP-ribose pyrophosphatase YjhB (NUDIX family)
VTEYHEDTTDVVVLVVRHREEDGDHYLLGKNWSTDFWEFVGGKRKKDEPFEHAAKRELQDKVEYDWDMDTVSVEKVGEPFESPYNEMFELYPVLVEIPSETAWELGPENMNEDHNDMAWVQLGQWGQYETLEQEKALERLGLI